MRHARSGGISAKLIFAIVFIAIQAINTPARGTFRPKNASSSPVAPLEQPEAASPARAPGAQAPAEGWTSKTYAVAAANPLAAQAGQRMLRAGGAAIDAAIATQMVLALVEPQSSGLGGGAFLLYYDGRTVHAYDGRETAPAGVSPQELQDAKGQALARAQAIVGGRAVGVPGMLRMLEMAHRQHGKLPWARLFAPAIALAQQGFPISPRLAHLVATDPHLRKDPVAAAYFYAPDGTPWPAGHVLRNPELADMLHAIATTGADALMQGAIAQAMVNKVQNHASNPGKLQLQDLADYQALQREPLCFDYAAVRRAYRICGMPAPSSGTLAMGQILGMLAHTPAASLPLHQEQPNADWLHLYAESARLAFADRDYYVADPAFTAAPAGQWRSLLHPDYLAQRAQSIGTHPESKTQGPVQPGQPNSNPNATTVWGRAPTQIETGTTHISVMDAHGHGLAMTSTIEDAFGARQMVNRGQGLVGGFLLNNELTDFSFSPTDAAGQPIANRIESGKRPRSSMAPTLVFDKATGQLLYSLGSPGGAAIIHFTTKTLYGMLHWGLSPQAAIDLPNFGTTGGPVFLEAGRFAPTAAQALRARGHTVAEFALTSGIQAIARTPGGWVGGADPRREGIMLGD
jgi:gamma-glutamyltranspeptidase / glutathione hydrolase